MHRGCATLDMRSSRRLRDPHTPVDYALETPGTDYRPESKPGVVHILSQGGPQPREQAQETPAERLIRPAGKSVRPGRRQQLDGEEKPTAFWRWHPRECIPRRAPVHGLARRYAARAGSGHTPQDGVGEDRQG